MKYLILFLLCIPLAGKSQELTPEGKITMTVEQGSRIDYWARKGISCEPLLSALDIQIQLLKMENRFQDTITGNLMRAQTEYRSMIARLGDSNQNLTLRAVEAERKLLVEKERVKKLKNTIFIGGAAVALLGYLIFH